MPAYNTENVTYDEMRAISDLLTSHLNESGKELRAFLVFGPLIETGATLDIEILEIRENWQGPRRVSFRSTVDLPLRGRLTLYFLTPEEFENPTSAILPDVEFSALTLLRRVDEAYAVFFERPYRYVFDTMQRFDTRLDSPKAFFNSLSTVAAAR